MASIRVTLQSPQSPITHFTYHILDGVSSQERNGRFELYLYPWQWQHWIRRRELSIGSRNTQGGFAVPASFRRSVFRRLGLAKVPEDLVTQIAASFHTDNSYSISILKEVVADAERKPLASLEGEKQKAEEKRMYQPLEQIFSYIE